MINVGQTRELPNRGSIALKLIGINDLWDVIFTQQVGQEGLRSLRVSVLLKENIEHEPMLVNRPPQPMPDAVHACAGLVQKPAGTPTGFTVTQFFREQWSEFKTPFAEGFMTDLNTALVQ